MFATLKKGDRVRFSVRAHTLGIADKPRHGVVVGFSRAKGCVAVRRGKRVKAELFAPWFWQRDSDGAIGRALEPARKAVRA